jgi:hypothetical protein
LLIIEMEIVENCFVDCDQVDSDFHVPVKPTSTLFLHELLLVDTSTKSWTIALLIIEMEIVDNCFVDYDRVDSDFHVPVKPTSMLFCMSYY